MSLFETLRPMTHEQAVRAADALEINGVVAIRVDSHPAFVVFVSSAGRGLPYEVDFVCTGDDLEKHGLTGAPPSPLPMTQEEFDVLTAWAGPAVAQICTLWLERHPPKVKPS